MQSLQFNILYSAGPGGNSNKSNIIGEEFAITHSVGGQGFKQAFLFATFKNLLYLDSFPYDCPLSILYNMCMGME